jgi:type II secretory pathway component PulK
MSVKASDGAVVILVLWILAILALLGLGLGYAATLDQRLVGYQRDRLTALYLAKAGYFRALAELKRDATPQVDSFLDPWADNPEAFREAALGEGSVTVSYPLRGEGGVDEVVYGVVDEERRVNLNTAPKAVLVRVPGMTGEIADAIVDWRAERALGESRDRAFEVLEELLLVEGMTDEVLQAVRPWVTIYGDGKVNLNTAPREVLKALGLGADLVDKLLRFRSGLDGVRGTGDDQMFASLTSAGSQLTAFDSLTPQETAELTNLIAQNRLKVTSSFFRIHASGRARAGKILRSVEGVVRRGTGQSGTLTLLAWHEN